MAHLIFLAKKRESASYRLAGPAVLGRSVECDVYVPDVFVSRHHCRFEPAADGEGWTVTDTGSRNGIFFHGKRIRRRALRHGDRLEIGSFAVRFETGDIPPRFSTPIPFGQGTSVAPLMDTLFAGDLRPAEYLRQNRPKPAWVRAKEEAAEAARRAAEHVLETARTAAARLDFGDGAELDLELQIAEQAEALLPNCVLISRELLGRYEALLDQESPAPARNPTTSREVAAATAGASAGGPVDVGALDARRRGGPAGPGDRLKNLWEVASLPPPADANAGPGTPGRPGVVVESTLRERFADWRAAYNVSVGHAVRIARASPFRAATAGAVAASLTVGGLVWVSRPPTRKPVNFGEMPVKEQRDVLIAQGN